MHKSILLISLLSVQIQLKEVILEDGDICKALLDYISRNLINSIVLGAATRGSISRFN